MKRNKVINVGDPTNACNGCNKRYVDVKTNNFLRIDGSKAMTGDLNMGQGVSPISRSLKRMRTVMLSMLDFSTKNSQIAMQTYKPLLIINMKSTSVIDSIILCQVQIRKTSFNISWIIPLLNSVMKVI